MSRIGKNRCSQIPRHRKHSFASSSSIRQADIPSKVLLVNCGEREGYIYRPSQPRFIRTAASYILGNRFYIGELHRNGQVFEGQYKRVIDRATFDACQDVMNGRNRPNEFATSTRLAGGLFRCAYCGQSITGERIRRKLKGGGVREHIYYRCANNHPSPDHPTYRWTSEELEQAVVVDLAKLRIATSEVADWFSSELSAAVTDLSANRRRQAGSFANRKSELVTIHDRLLNAYLAGTIDESVYKPSPTNLQGREPRK